MGILYELLNAADRDGWAYGIGTLDGVRLDAARSRFRLLSNRTGDPVVSILAPLDADHAKPNSMSARTGAGSQPLHTDGAHQLQPPDYVVLANEHPTPTATRLWRFSSTEDVRHDLAHGLFTVRSGTRTFLAPAYAGGCVRYDPLCMQPSDGRSRRAADYLNSKLAESVAFEWDRAGLILLIANGTALHGRDDASTDPGRMLKRIALRVDREHHSRQPHESQWR